MRATSKLFLLALACFALAQPSIADDDDGDDERRERGPRTKFENNDEHYKYEYRDHRCKYKYEYKYRTGKTKVEQKGDCRGIVMARPVAHGESLPRAIPPEPQAQRVTCNREVVGAILGGAIGATVGSRAGEGRDRRVMTLGGAVIGAVVGGAIGRSMDEADQACAAQALEYAKLEQSVVWDDPERGASYTITPTQVVRSSRGDECRKYLLQSAVGGRVQKHSGTACRQDNGAWTLVE